MIIIKNVPLVSLQQAIFRVLKDGQDAEIYGGDIPATASSRYITIGAVTAKPIAVKDLVLWNCTVNIDVWAGPNEKRKVNEMLNDISALITFRGPDMKIMGYQVISAEIDMVEAFPSTDNGYHGTLTAGFSIQKN